MSNKDEGLIVRAGGIRWTTEIDTADAFEATLARLYGQRVRGGEEGLGEALWAALANIEWRHAERGRRGYTFRAAGDVVSALKRSGNYLDWYCCVQEGHVRMDIREEMAAEGWSWREL